MRTRLLVPSLALVLAALAATCGRDSGRPLGPAFLFFGKVDSTRIDFGPVAVGSSATRQLTITNVGDAPLAGEVAAPCPEFDVIEGRGAYVLAPAESLLVSVRFRPTSAGPKSCRLATGSRCTPVDLVGEGTGGGAECEINPIVIDFGLVPVGETADSTFTLRNLGQSPLTGDIVATCSGFRLGTGGGSYSLAPGESLVVEVTFAPEFPGPQVCTITTGLLRCPLVVCTGTGGGAGGECELAPVFIDFGFVRVGETADSTFTLWNRGQSPLAGDIVATCGGFRLGAGGGSYSLPPGDSLVVEVVFAPEFPGPQGCAVATGLLLCPVVACAGTGTGSDSLDCSQAVSIAMNQPLTGNNTGAATNVSTYACTPSLDEWGSEVVYRLVLPSPVSITATLDNLSADLDLFLLSACDADSCLAAAVLPGTNPDVITTSLGAGAYYLVVDGYLGATSAYRIQVVPGAGAAGPPPFESRGPLRK